MYVCTYFINIHYNESFFLVLQEKKLYATTFTVHGERNACYTKVKELETSILFDRWRRHRFGSDVYCLMMTIRFIPLFVQARPQCTRFQTLMEPTLLSKYYLFWTALLRVAFGDAQLVALFLKLTCVILRFACLSFFFVPSY